MKSSEGPVGTNSFRARVGKPKRLGTKQGNNTYQYGMKRESTKFLVRWIDGTQNRLYARGLVLLRDPLEKIRRVKGNCDWMRWDLKNRFLNGNLFSRVKNICLAL